jgi:hypothetical protein
MRDYLPRALSRSVPLAAATVAAVALAGCGAVRPAAQTTAFPATALRSATVRLSAARAHLARASAARAFVTPRPAARRIAAPYLSSVFFLSPVRGYGLFLRQAGSRCAYLVGRTSDGGARFAKPVTAAQWRCDDNAPVASLVFDSSGDRPSGVSCPAGWGQG